MHIQFTFTIYTDRKQKSGVKVNEPQLVVELLLNIRNVTEKEASRMQMLGTRAITLIQLSQIMQVPFACVCIQKKKREKQKWSVSVPKMAEVFLMLSTYLFTQLFYIRSRRRVIFSPSIIKRRIMNCTQRKTTRKKRSEKNPTNEKKTT